jgi:hypothetical protein
MAAGRGEEEEERRAAVHQQVVAVLPPMKRSRNNSVNSTLLLAALETLAQEAQRLESEAHSNGLPPGFLRARIAAMEAQATTMDPARSLNLACRTEGVRLQLAVFQACDRLWPLANAPSALGGSPPTSAQAPEPAEPAESAESEAKPRAPAAPARQSGQEPMREAGPPSSALATTAAQLNETSSRAALVACGTSPEPLGLSAAMDPPDARPTDRVATSVGFSSPTVALGSTPGEEVGTWLQQAFGAFANAAAISTLGQHLGRVLDDFADVSLQDLAALLRDKGASTVRDVVAMSEKQWLQMLGAFQVAGHREAARRAAAPAPASTGDSDRALLSIPLTSWIDKGVVLCCPPHHLGCVAY